VDFRSDPLIVPLLFSPHQFERRPQAYAFRADG
jgi:hypothetical protein